MDNEGDISNVIKEETNTILNIDMNILQDISLITFNRFIKDIYRDIIKLYNVNTYFKEIINNILIENDSLLLDIILYINSINKDVNFYSVNFKDLLNKWNNYKEYRVQHQNIYIYLNTIKTTENRMKINSNKLNMNNFDNLGITLANCKEIKRIPQKYKDKNGLINDINVAYNHIQSNNTCVYKLNISVELHDYSKLDNFELFCIAVRKHITLYKQMIKLYSINITPEQILILVKNNYSIYKSLTIKNKNRIDIIEEIILNSKDAFKIMHNNKNILSSNLILNIFNNLTEKYDLNNKENSEKNKNYIYFMLNYITLTYINNESKKHLKDNLENNNNLFNICYNKLKYYIENAEYYVFEIDNIEIDFYNATLYSHKFTNNHRWKYYKFCEDIDISLQEIVDEVNTLNINDGKITRLYNENKINIYYLCTIYKRLNKIKHYCFNGEFRTHLNFINYHPLLKELLTQLLGDINENQSVYFYDIMKKHYLPELNKLEALEYDVNCLLH